MAESGATHYGGCGTMLLPSHPPDMPTDQALKCLDELLAELGGMVTGTQSVGPCGALLEHLQAARRGLLGSMPGEYLLSLHEAKVSLNCISDKSVRAEVKKTLRRLEEPTQRSFASPVSGRIPAVATFSRLPAEPPVMLPARQRT